MAEDQRTWQVQLSGEGFVREGQTSSFELSAVVCAQNAQAALEAAVILAAQKHPELLQAVRGHGVGPRINVDEIQQIDATMASLGDVFEVHWSV
ncbi:hypothetical protein [Roseateles sp.]|uniref:hypothetical protein n=1 Tax=Roseateles sp. TaxID=1971397 RepID=UPI00326674C8